MNISRKEMDNPFSLDPVQSVDQFVGRERVTRQVLDLLDKGQHVSIVGQDKIGKTSFLYHVADPQVRARYGLLEEHVFVYIDSRPLAASDQETWYRHMEQETIRQIGLDTPNGEEVRARLEAAVQSAGSAAGPWRFQRFFHAIKRQHLKVILVLDNFEVLAKSPNLGSGFFSVMRSIHANYPVTYLVTSLLPLHDIEDAQVEGSPFFNIFFPIGRPDSNPLGELDPQESRRLVQNLLNRSGIHLPEPVIECILELGHNTPYKLKYVGRIAVELWNQQAETAPGELCRQIRKNARLT